MKQTQLVTHALVLAICAPDDEKAKKASDLAEHFAKGLDPAEVEKCKTKALAIVAASGVV